MLYTPEQIVSFYQEAYKKNGATPWGMRWSDPDTHWKRLMRIKGFLQTLDVSFSRILDVGCGIGWLFRVWDLQHKPGTYHGVDIVPEYIEEAKKITESHSNAIVTCGDFMEWEAIDPFSVTVAVGTFAWQPKEVVVEMLLKMWSFTQPGGAMAFTFIPDNPLSRFDVKWLADRLEAEEFLLDVGYSNRLNEHIAVMVKSEEPIETDSEEFWLGEEDNVEVVRDALSLAFSPYRHQEEIEDEVLRGEHRD